MMLRRTMSRLFGPSSSAVLARGAAGTFVVMAFGTGLLYGVHVLLANVMGAEHYGVFAYVLAWSAILLLFAKMGLDSAILRFVAAYRAREEWACFRGILRRSDQLALAASVLVGAVAASTVWALRSRLGPELTRTFWIASALLPVTALLMLRQSALRALGRPVLASAINSVLRPVLLGVLVLASLLLLAGETDGPTAMALYGLALVGCLYAGSRGLRASLPPASEVEVAEFRDREWLGMALPAFAMSGMSLILQQTDKVMIGVIMGTTEAGIYAAASQTATLMQFALQAVNAVLAPMISGLYASGRREELQRVVTLAARGIFAFCLPAGLVLILVGRHILGVFGAEFADGYGPLVILAGAQLVNALCGSVGLLMTMTGSQIPATAIMVLSALLNVGLNCILIPRLGLVGAAAATGAAMAVRSASMLVYVVRRLGLNSTVFPMPVRNK